MKTSCFSYLFWVFPIAYEEGTFNGSIFDCRLQLKRRSASFTPWNETGEWETQQSGPRPETTRGNGQWWGTTRGNGQWWGTTRGNGQWWGTPQAGASCNWTRHSPMGSPPRRWRDQQGHWILSGRDFFYNEDLHKMYTVMKCCKKYTGCRQ